MSFLVFPSFLGSATGQVLRRESQERCPLRDSRRQISRDGCVQIEGMTFFIKGAQWTVPQLSIMIIYNSTWSFLIQWIMDILSGDNLT